MRVVGYVRLSRDEDRESYSSILSQKSIIEEYALKNNWIISKYYEDDNCSGYTFDRPGLNELTRDMESNCIDIVIAKDLSRIGRHNAYTLLFLDKIKRLNKRLILPKEGSGYDTAEDESDLLGITTWYNEMYVKDISRKIRGSIKVKQREGRMIIKEAFGYQKCSSDKHRLEIDLEAAAIVREIFKLYLSGIGYRKIAEILNAEAYPTPSLYGKNKAKGLSGSVKAAEQWNSVHVQRILKNDIYIGTLRLAKTEKKTIKGKSQKQPESLQYIFENNHPAIISQEEFDEVRQTAESRKNSKDKGAASLHNIFSGLVFCQECGSYMVAYNRLGKAKSYICGSYHKHGKKSCRRHTIQEAILQEAVREFLKTAAAFWDSDVKKLLLNNSTKLDPNEQLLKKLIQEQSRSKEQLKLLIMQKVAELKKDNCSEYQTIIKDSLRELEEELKKKLLYLGKRIKELEAQQSKSTDAGQRTLEELLWDVIDAPQPSKKNMRTLINKILIDSRGNPTIYMKADFEALCVHSREAVIAY